MIAIAERLRLAEIHHVRHTVASLLKDLSVPARDAQIILGHSRLAVMLEIYTQAEEQRNATRSPGSMTPSTASMTDPLLQIPVTDGVDDHEIPHR